MHMYMLYVITENKTNNQKIYAQVSIYEVTKCDSQSLFINFVNFEQRILWRLSKLCSNTCISHGKYTRFLRHMSWNNEHSSYLLKKS